MGIFNIDNFGNISANGKNGIPSWWTYNATADDSTLANALTANYFDALNTGSRSIVAINDIIYVEATDGNQLIVVTAFTPHVTTAAFPVVGAGAIGTTQLANGAVTLAKLSAGITPSHVDKFANKYTWAGSGATAALSLPGVLSTDIVTATFQNHGTQGSSFLTAVPTTDTITFGLSTANTSNDAVIAYQVLRAAS